MRQLRPAVLALVLAASTAQAWGPHTEITIAALRVLPNRERLEQYLGSHFHRLAKDYCWMGDWKEAVRPDHYADDYLLFPGMTRHVSHMLPEVRQTYAPYFKRALQAIRTESPQNAARWVGSLLHFVQDSGSPPHTTGIGGLLHGKMERWVDESKIDIAGYQPRILGQTEDQALKGFLERMEQLVEFSRIRAVKLKPLVESLKERQNQPLELECALETARVTADLVHTLFVLGMAPNRGSGCTLEGVVHFKSPSGYAEVPARLMIADTLYATTTDRDRSFTFRNLPPGKVRLLVLATGYEASEIDVDLSPGAPVNLKIDLKPDAMANNLIRNSQFKLKYLNSDRPDWWTPDPKQAGRFTSALMRIPVSARCRLRVDFHEGQSASIAVRWRGNPSDVNDSRESAIAVTDEAVILTPDARVRPFDKGFLFLEVLIAAKRPNEVCRFVGVELLP